MSNMEFDFGSIRKKELTVGSSPNDSLLNMDLPGESKELKGENKVHVQDMVKSTKQNNYFTNMILKYN